MDVSDALLSLTPGISLFGRVEIATGVSPPPSVIGKLWFSAPMADSATGSGLTLSRVVADGSFSLATPEGTRVIRLEEVPPLGHSSRCSIRSAT